MTSLKIPCISLQGTSTYALVIPAPELADYFSATSVLVQAQSEAANLQLQAEAELTSAREEAEKIRAHAHLKGLADAADELISLRETLIKETLEWHVAETQLESTIAKNLDTRLRSLVAQVLEEYLGDKNALELLTQRVQQRITSFLDKGNITLRVPSDSVSKFQESLLAYPQVRIIGAASLKNTQALLETHLFTLRLDLETHLESLLSRLRQTTF